MTNDEVKKRKSELALQARVLRLEELVDKLMKELEAYASLYTKGMMNRKFSCRYWEEKK